MNNNFNTGARIHELRIQQGLSQEQLALRAEITTTYLGLIERNLKNPTIKIIEQLCNSLNMRALKKSDSLLKELGFFYEKWYNGNERRGIEHAER